MQLNVFNTDEHKSGFRLYYLEVYNWGTFDEHVHAIRPMGETSLLTGANGSGKTTFVDALLTLMVPEKKYRFYNQSSGSEKKGDRSEESYVLGGYGTINSETSSGSKTLYLRESREESYSILLAHFSNEADQQVTLFQVRYFSGSDMKRVFGIAHTALHIEDDFTPFDLGGNWKRALEARHNRGKGKIIEWFDGAGKYAQRMIEVMGMQSVQALSLFNQTVGIKVLGNLDEFIRTNMLEPRNMEQQFLELKKHLGMLLEAQRGIEKAETQIALLKPLRDHYLSFTAGQQKLVQKKTELDTLKVWNSYTRYYLLTEAISQGKAGLSEVQYKLEELGKDIENLLEQERQTKNQLEQNQAGQRLQQLEAEMKALHEQLKESERQLHLFGEYCKELALQDLTCPDEAAYKRIKTDVSRVVHRLEREQRLNEDDEFEAKNLKNKAEKDKTDVEVELNLVLHSRNNIPGHLINLRKELCAALKLDTSDLPFAGELMQLKPEEMDWQPALEKLLHSFALRLLVPDHLYKKVTRYVNNTDLRTRLIYHHITDVAMDLLPDEGTVYEKLDFHPDHPLADWVQNQIILQFNYYCLEDESYLDEEEKAITINGLIKNRDRHEKDDRSARNDPGMYVMGWNNEKKRTYLQEKRQQCVDIIEKATETIDRCTRKSKKIQTQWVAVSQLKDHAGFQLIDVSAMQRKIHHVEEQVQELKGSSDQLQVLTSQLEEHQRSRLEKQAERSTLERSLALREADLNSRQQELSTYELLIQHVTEADKDQLLHFQQQYADRLSALSLDQLSEVYESLKKEMEEAVENYQGAVHKDELLLTKAIRAIKAPSFEIQQRFPDWNGDVHHFPEDSAYAGEYIEWLEKLETENLPGYKKDFERFLHETIVYKIGELAEELESWEQNIRGSILTLNQSLGGICFNKLPDTYIQLGIRPVTDTTIKEFRYKLIESLPQAANWQQSSFEEKADHFRERVQPLFAALEESESYRSRVLDVRNWFEFWADEKYTETDETKKTYHQMGQLSGGEKAQLTYTILCSAIAYQFGITREGKNTKSLRFIAIDESFSNQDEDKATYLMQLCRQLHLQLLVVTPSDKIHIVQNYIAHVHLVQRVNNRNSVLYNMTVKELKESKEEELV